MDSGIHPRDSQYRVNHVRHPCQHDNHVTGQTALVQVQLSDVIAQLAHVLRQSEAGVSAQVYITTFTLHADD